MEGKAGIERKMNKIAMIGYMYVGGPLNGGWIVASEYYQTCRLPDSIMPHNPFYPGPIDGILISFTNTSIIWLFECARGC